MRRWVVSVRSSRSGIPTSDKGPDRTEGASYETADAAPPGREEGRDTFSGQETMADLAEEVAEKPT